MKCDCVPESDIGVSMPMDLLKIHGRRRAHLGRFLPAEICFTRASHVLTEGESLTGAATKIFLPGHPGLNRKLMSREIFQLLGFQWMY